MMMHTRSHRGRVVIGLVFLCALLVVGGVDTGPAGAATQPPAVVTVPLSALAVDDTTVTVTVLQDPMEPVHMMLKLCESGLPVGDEEEDRDLAANLERLCRAIDRVTRGLEDPRHELEAGDYIVTIPLSEPRGSLHAVVWKASTLDDAVAFVELVQGGKLKAMTVYSRYPTTAKTAPSCSACPIKELVFSAAGLKGHRPALEPRGD